tara:strand:+ start:34 stop:555 length:522 start_codon:yes stop_codon:yes gene_type:complete
MAIHKIDGVDAVDGGSVINSFPKKFVTLNITLAASATATKGEWVAIDLDETTAGGLGGNCEQSTTALPQLVFGVFAETITNSSASATLATTIKVQVAGLAEGCAVESSVAAGDLLVASTTTAGHAIEVDSATAVAGNAQANIQNALKLARVGTALTAHSGGTATCMIIDQGYF